MSVKVNINIDYDQIRNIIDQLNEDEQNKLAAYLDEVTLYRRWDKLQEDLKNINLTPEDIQKEVEIVREKRYNNCE